ncbi:MAG: PIN domain-containing protein [Candidatus Omnitrophota bacterium]|jgi:predicted nucleic acid-binding protein|nr:MAG: PIN domain-containing protein [Candidatus Omnitrophota bacterium]
MEQRAIRVYVETSVFGGVFDDEFSQASRTFFDLIRMGKFHLLISALVEEELQPAPMQVRSFFDEMIEFYEVVGIPPEAFELQQAYLHAGIVSPKRMNDALHVAVATISGCKMIVSWNFKHIVHYQKIQYYNAVNTLNGYDAISIYSPLEVIGDENQDV